jgi:hypothetical protein
MKTKIYTRQIKTGLGTYRWQFGVPGILHPGTISWSLNNWATKASAARAGRREFWQ